MDSTTEYTTTATPMHLTVDPWWQNIEVLAYGTVCDSLDGDRYVGLIEDRVALVLDESRTEVTGFVAHKYTDLDDDAIEDPALWEGHRFHIPVLGLTQATVGEALLAIRGRFGAEEPTADALHFHVAMDCDTPEEALGQWQLALAAGDMKAHYAIGYTLCGLGRHRQAYSHLRRYTELVPENAWAWCWLGQACAGSDQPTEARAAYERAIEIDDDTDAAELLAELDA